MQFCKKASLNLSINAIVILILAITMLGLGLGFMKSMFGKVTKQLATVSEDIESQIIDDIERSGAKLTFLQKKISIQRSGEQDLFFGVKNQLAAPQVFYFNFNCYDTLRGEAESSGVFFEFPDNTVRPVGEADVFVRAVKILASPDAETTVYTCEAIAAISEIDTTGDGFALPSVLGAAEYARETFFVTVS